MSEAEFCKAKVLAIPVPNYVTSEVDLAHLLFRNPKLLGDMKFIAKEFGLGKGKVDLLGERNGELFIIELKLVPKLNDDNLVAGGNQLNKYMRGALTIAKVFGVERRIKPLLVFGVQQGEGGESELKLDASVKDVEIVSFDEETAKRENQLAKIKREISEVKREKQILLRQLNEEIAKLERKKSALKKEVSKLDISKVQKKLNAEINAKRLEIQAIRQELSAYKRKLREIKKVYYEMVETRKGKKLVYKVGSYGKGLTAELVGTIENGKFVPHRIETQSMV